MAAEIRKSAFELKEITLKGTSCNFLRGISNKIIIYTVPLLFKQPLVYHEKTFLKKLVSKFKKDTKLVFQIIKPVAILSAFHLEKGLYQTCMKKN